MKKPYIDYNEWLLKRLHNPEEALEYLNACYEDGLPEIFLGGLRKVVIAQGGIANLAKKAKLNREHLFRMLSERGNPELASLSKLINALGWKMEFSMKEKAKKRKAGSAQWRKAA